MPLSWDQPIKEELRMVEEEIMRNTRSGEPLLTEIATHVISSGGKRMRPGITILSFRAVEGTDLQRTVMLAAAFELVHSATLVHDDINDGADTRRGTEAAYRKYGTQRALITGDFLFVKGFRLGGLVQSDEVVELVADACSQMAESEMLQTMIEHDADLSFEAYVKIITGKTAKPIQASAQVGAYLGGGSSDQIAGLGDFGLNIGLAFQIVDDILDITGKEEDLGKRRGMDVLDGKANLPLMIAMQEQYPSSSRIREIYRKTVKTEEEVEEALRLVQATDALDLARKHADDLRLKALNGLEALPESKYKDALRTLADTILVRDR